MLILQVDVGTRIEQELTDRDVSSEGRRAQALRRLGTMFDKEAHDIQVALPRSYVQRCKPPSDATVKAGTGVKECLYYLEVPVPRSSKEDRLPTESERVRTLALGQNLFNSQSIATGHSLQEVPAKVVYRRNRGRLYH